MEPQLYADDGNIQSSPSLAALLKYHNDDGVVIRFDTDMLKRTCMRTSPHFLSNIDLDELVQDIFPPGEYWANRDLLYSSISSFGHIHGFMPSKNSYRIVCSRSGTKVYTKKFKAGGLMCDCSFFLSLKTKYNPITVPKKDMDSSTNPGKPRADYPKLGYRETTRGGLLLQYYILQNLSTL